MILGMIISRSILQCNAPFGRHFWTAAESAGEKIQIGLGVRSKEFGRSTVICNRKKTRFFIYATMPSTRKVQKAAARARAAKYQKKTASVEAVEISSDSAIEQPEPDGNHDSDIECMGWTGGVNYVSSDTDTDTDTPGAL